MRILGNKKRFAAVAATAAAVLVGGGIAVAYWTTTGSGSGSATTANPSGTLTVNQTNTITDLYPGITPVDIDLEIVNPDAAPYYVDEVVVAIDDSAFPVGCTAADYVVTDGTIDDDVPGSATTAYTGTGASIAMVNSATNQDACKGVTVPLTFTTTS